MEMPVVFQSVGRRILYGSQSAASMKEEGGQHVHGWENITLLEEEVALENRLIA